MKPKVSVAQQTSFLLPAGRAVRPAPAAQATWPTPCRWPPLRRPSGDLQRGRPARQTRSAHGGPLLLRQLENLSDEVAVAHAQNEYDGHTLSEVLEWTWAITDQRPQRAIVDRGYRGRQTVGTTEILLPGRPAKDQSPSRTQQQRRSLQRRVGYRAGVSHLKQDLRVGRCFLKGAVGDALNLMLARAA